MSFGFDLVKRRVFACIKIFIYCLVKLVNPRLIRFLAWHHCGHPTEEGIIWPCSLPLLVVLALLFDERICEELLICCLLADLCEMPLIP